MYVKENAEALVVATKEIGPEVNADKTKSMVMARDQNSGRNHSMKTDNSSIERVEEFKYLGTTLTNQNSIRAEIKSRLKLGNACYYSVQNLLSSRLLTYLLTPWSRVVFEKLTGFAASQEIPPIYGTRKFITVFTNARHLSLS
jgi:hypothetical protein